MRPETVTITTPEDLRLWATPYGFRPSRGERERHRVLRVFEGDPAVPARKAVFLTELTHFGPTPSRTLYRVVYLPGQSPGYPGTRST